MTTEILNGGWADAGSPAWRVYEKLDSEAIYLTFDDGPNPHVTPDLLRLLAEANVKATFFVSGASLTSRSAQAILRLIAGEGHTVGNHGLLHEHDAYPMFDQMHDEIFKICGISTKLIRSPYGYFRNLRRYLETESVAVAFHWSVEFRDFEPLDAAQVRLGLSQIVPGSIILLHDGVAPTALYKDRSQVMKLTETILDYARQRGFPVRDLAFEFPTAYLVD
jgi:chitooligosaccharide deacetylase